MDSLSRKLGYRSTLGMSLVEVTVVVVVLGILMAIAIPALLGARAAARASECLANCRACSQVLGTYAADYRDCFPIFAATDREPAFENAGMGLWYEMQSFFWPLGCKAYLCGRGLCPTQLCPGGPVSRDAFQQDGYDSVMGAYPPSWTFGSDYRLSMSVFSDPKLWRPGGSWTDFSFRHAVRWADVTRPAHKGILVELRAFHNGGDPYGAAPAITLGPGESRNAAFSIGFADGHVAQLPAASLVPGFDPWTQAEGVPVLQTRDGVRGTDLRP